MRSPPFRRAVASDPYFNRLSATVKHNYWKIFKSIPHTQSFKELIEKTVTKYPHQRYSIDQIRGSNFLDGEGEQIYTIEKFLEEIKQRHEIVEKEVEESGGKKHNHESTGMYNSETEADDEYMIKDNEEFQDLRLKYLS